jgi:electron transfer flavoprotein alpha subunit
MKQALFILQVVPGTKPAEYGTFSGLAARLAAAGYSSDLLLVTRSADSSVLVSYGDSFRSVVGLKVSEEIGDGADYLARLVPTLDAAKEADLIVAFSTIANRNWAPQVAAILKCEYLAGCERVDATEQAVSFSGPLMGGLIQKTVTISGVKAVVLYDGDALAPKSGSADTSVALSSNDVPSRGVRFIKSEALPDTAGLPLRGATKVVSGGLGVGSAEKWPLIEQFASKVEAAVGASRAAVEMGWVPSSRQVGFSGHKVSPDVYVAVGISGAVHHLAGISGAKTVIAINKDPEAAIFKVADIGIVGDYEQILGAALKKLGN